MNGDRNIPAKWILIVSAIFAFLELGISLGLFFSPESILEEVDLGARGVKYLVYMWATRQFALGVILAYATLKRSSSLLTPAYLFLLVMFLGDVLTGFLQKNNSLVIAGIVMSIISAALLMVNKKRV